MTHMTETIRTLTPRWRSLECSSAMPLNGIPSAPTGSVAMRAFALRAERACPGSNGIVSRAFPKGEDS